MAGKRAFDILKGVYKTKRFRGTTPYAQAMRDNPFSGELTGTINPRYYRALREEGEETLARMPTQEQFQEAVTPTLEMMAGRPRKVGPLAPVLYRMDPAHASLGLRVPRNYASYRSSSGTVARPDRIVAEHLKEGRVDQASELLYDQVQNVARLYPTSIAESRAAFYAVKGLRDDEIAKVTGIPRYVVNAISSINSAQAGPALEELRTLAIIRFLRVTKSGKVSFDLGGFKRVYGPNAHKQPGISLVLRNIQKGNFDDPDLVNKILLGLSDKTYPYNILGQAPGSPFASVADTIDAGARVGAAAGEIPANAQEAFLAQLPTRAVATALGKRPSEVQTGDWLLSRALKGEAASRAPMTYVQSSDELAEIAAGRLDFGIGGGGLAGRRATFRPGSRPGGTSREAQEFFTAGEEGLSARITAAKAKRAAGEPLSDLESRLSDFYVVSAGNKVSVNPDSVAAVLPPASREKMLPVLTKLLEDLPSLRGAARMEAIATIMLLTGAGSVASARFGATSPNVQAIMQMAGEA
jgi:hypothetical protein